MLLKKVKNLFNSSHEQQNTPSKSEITIEVPTIDDPLLEEAANFIIEAHQASTSLLQRSFGISYNRSSRIIQALEKCAVIGPQIGSHPREVLINPGIKIAFIENPELLHSLNQECLTHIVEDNRMDVLSGISNGEEFEQFIAHLLLANGFHNVEVTKGSDDQGVDIIAHKSDIVFAIQSKFYSGSVGNDAVQQIFAGKQYYHAHIGAVVTNTTFTPSAIELAYKTNILLWDINWITKMQNLKNYPFKKH